MAGKRLFVAIDLPESIANLLARLNPHIPGVRWLRPDQIHLTVAFLGSVDSSAEKILHEKLSAVHFAPFFMPVMGVGSFPAKGPPRVLWAGVGKGHPQLFHMHKRVQEALLASGLEPELRAWHPHYTFARCRDVSPEQVRPFLKEQADLDAGLVRVEAFSLYSSTPGPLGSAYTLELAVPATRS